MNEPPLITHGTGRFPPPRVIAQSMHCDHGKHGDLNRFTVTFVIESYDERVEATIAAVASNGLSNTKGGHLSIDFLKSETANCEPRTAN